MNEIALKIADILIGAKQPEKPFNTIEDQRDAIAALIEQATIDLWNHKNQAVAQELAALRVNSNAELAEIDSALWGKGEKPDSYEPTRAIRISAIVKLAEKSAQRADALKGLSEAAKNLNEIVEGVRSERWSACGIRLKDTPEWCAFYSALANTPDSATARSDVAL
jgi:hypothetical protein